MKQEVLSSITGKNSGIRSLVEQGFVLDMIYFREHNQSSCTIGIKVSPEIRDYIFDKNNGKLYVFSARCSVTDRLHIRQCYHCQIPGHTTSTCQNLQSDPTCMYCSGPHRSTTCTHKHSRHLHKCANCSRSTDSTISARAGSHHAGSHLCPVMQAAMNSASGRQSKN